MSITVNEKTLVAVLTETQGKDELITLLNEIIDSEIEKNDEMNTELVDECVMAIIDLESGENLHTLEGYQSLLNFCHTNAFRKRIRLKRAAIIAAVAAIATSVTITSSPALAKQARDMFNSIMINLGLAADRTDSGNAEIVSIYLTTNDNATFVAKNEEDINTDNISIIAVDKDNFERQISLSDCTVNKERIDESHVMVTFSYEGCACSLIYTLEVTK
ncbi:MAG: hypothetical protein IJ077_03065 [Eubacterium sp.]|nr:hypothetical protein [Eubacterium sp.]